MLMLFIHSVLWCIAAAVAIYFAVLSFKRKWYLPGILDVGLAFIDLFVMIDTIVNYFTN